MLSKVFSAATYGIDAYIVTVETHIENQMPAFVVVGLPDSAVRESRERVTAAIKNATSILDFVFRALGYEYLGREDFVHVKSIDETSEKPLASFNTPPVMMKESRQIIVEEKNYPSGNGSTEDEPVYQSKSNGNTRFVEARAQGYTGEQCNSCGSLRVKRNGSCTVCEDCGTTSGCS